MSNFTLRNNTPNKIVLDNNIVLEPGETQSVETLTNAVLEAFGRGIITIDPVPEAPAPVPVDSILDIHVNTAAGIQLSKLAGGSLILLSNGTVPLTATFDAGNQKIINLQNPTNPQDACTKAYADSVIGAVYTAGYGLNLSLNQFSVALANGTLTVGPTGLKLTDLPTGMILIGNSSNVATPQAVSGDASLSATGVLTLANTGVIAGTYASVVVDSKGRVINGSTTQSWATLTGTPTTLAGYGITDGVKNGGNVESLAVDILANRPVAGVANRLFVSSDTFQFFRDNGTSWDPIGGSGTGTVTSVAVIGGTGLSTSGGPITTSGTITVNLADDVAAVEAITTTGFAVRTATNVWTTRSIQGAAGNISVTNPDGVAGSPVIDLANAGTPGAYVSVTTDTKGRVISGSTTQSWATITSTPTTLAGYGITDAQPLDATLSALAAFNSNGLMVQTAADTFTSRSLVAPAAGITITNGDGIAGNPTFALADDLSALEGLATTGLAARTATNTWATRSIAGTANEITVTNGDGVAGNPTLALASSLVTPGSLEVTGNVGFYGTTPVSQQTVTGSRANTEQALANLLTALANLGLIVNNTTA